MTGWNIEEVPVSFTSFKSYGIPLNRYISIKVNVTC